MGQKHAKYNVSSSGQSGGLLCCSSQNKKNARNYTVPASRIRKSQTRGKNLIDTYDEMIKDSNKRETSQFSVVPDHSDGATKVIEY